MTTETVVTAIPDTWVNPSRPGVNYGDANVLTLRSGGRYIYLRPALPNLAGKTIVDAYLVGRPAATTATSQTIVAVPVTSRMVVGRVTSNTIPTTNDSAAVGSSVSQRAADVPFTITGLGPIIQAVANGTKWYGLRLSTTAGSDQVFRATDSGRPAWELHIVISDAPEVPTNLRPDGGAVTTSSPIFAWDYENVGADFSTQVEARLQIDNPADGDDPDEVTPAYDSGWFALDVEEIQSPASISGTTRYWRVNVRDADGTESGWSDWASYTVAALPSLVVDSPTGPFGDPSPTIMAHLSSGTLSAWDILITGPDRSDVRASYGTSTDPDIEWTVPLRVNGRRVLEEGETSWARIRAWDDVERAVTVGQPGYRETWVELTYGDDLGVQAPTNLMVHQYAPGDPRLVWTWRRTEAADNGYLLTVDGKTVVRVEPEDVTVNAGVYSYTDNGEVSPLRPHTLGVKAMENSSPSMASEPATISEHVHEVIGVWLLERDRTPLQLAGEAVSGFTHVDRRARYEPLAGPPVDIIYDTNPGRTGSFAGSIDARQDVWAAVDRIEELRASHTRLVRMVWGSQSILVRLVDPDITSADGMLPSNLEHDVRFEFVQMGS